jgi:hypothetical protein
MPSRIFQEDCDGRQVVCKISPTRRRAGLRRLKVAIPLPLSTPWTLPLYGALQQTPQNRAARPEGRSPCSRGLSRSTSAQKRYDDRALIVAEISRWATRVTEDAKPFTKCIVPTVAFIISNVTICSSLDLHLRADPLDRSLWRRIFALVLGRESSKLLVGVEYRVDS